MISPLYLLIPIGLAIVLSVSFIFFIEKLKNTVLEDFFKQKLSSNQVLEAIDNIFDSRFQYATKNKLIRFLFKYEMKI